MGGGAGKLPPREIDLLSLDIDGIDIYLLQPILETVNPRVVVVEYQAGGA